MSNCFSGVGILLHTSKFLPSIGMFQPQHEDDVCVSSPPSQHPLSHPRSRRCPRQPQTIEYNWREKCLASPVYVFKSFFIFETVVQCMESLPSWPPLSGGFKFTGVQRIRSCAANLQSSFHLAELRLFTHYTPLHSLLSRPLATPFYFLSLWICLLWVSQRRHNIVFLWLVYFT